MNTVRRTASVHRSDTKIFLVTERSDRRAAKASLSCCLSPGSALHQTAMAACEEYRIDMTAAVFGTCKCGQPKLAHSAEALAPKKKRGSSRPVRLLSLYPYGFNAYLWMPSGS